MKIEKTISELKKRQIAVAQERDNLRELEEDVVALKESCEEAWDSLQRAIDSLSELV